MTAPFFKDCPKDHSTINKTRSKKSRRNYGYAFCQAKAVLPICKQMPSEGVQSHQAQIISLLRAELNPTNSTFVLSGLNYIEDTFRWKRIYTTGQVHIILVYWVSEMFFPFHPSSICQFLFLLEWEHKTSASSQCLDERPPANSTYTSFHDGIQRIINGRMDSSNDFLRDRYYKWLLPLRMIKDKNHEFPSPIWSLQ